MWPGAVTPVELAVALRKTVSHLDAGRDLEATETLANVLAIGGLGLHRLDLLTDISNAVNLAAGVSCGMDAAVAQWPESQLAAQQAARCRALLDWLTKLGLATGAIPTEHHVLH
jgi:hypothetical protein